VRKAPIWLLLAASAALLQGCSSIPDYANPIEWYRGITGASKNDDADNQRNSQNLEAGGKQPYPNLGSVPPPPGTAMSAIDRDKLEKGLVADRTNAKYSDDELRQGRSVPPLPGEAPAVAPDSALAAAIPGGGQGAATAAGGPRRASSAPGSEQVPQESPLTTPAAHATPTGDTPRLPPPSPTQGRQAEQASSAPPQLAMALPSLPRDRPASLPAIMQSPSGGKGSNIMIEAAEIGFVADGTVLSAEDNEHLAEVVRMYRQGGARLRVVGYGGRGTGAAAAQQELISFGTALDRANAVAQALTKLGVPAGHITVQAAPEPSDSGPEAGRAAVLLEY
jgi:outer membrane protein OmpA-like peptidoglycan-associated protein